MKCNNHCSPNRPDCRDNICTIDLRDKALQNHNYRETVWTGCFMQMTVMCIPACSDVGLEIHDNTDQIIRIEQGQCSVRMGCCPNELCFRQNLCQSAATSTSTVSIASSKNGFHPDKQLIQIKRLCDIVINSIKKIPKYRLLSILRDHIHSL